MAITLTQDWSSYADGTEVQNISGWTGSGAFAADAAGLKVNATSELKNSSTNGCLVFYDSGASSYYSEIVMEIAQSAGVISVGAAVRCTDYLNFIGVRYWGSALELYHRTGSTTQNRIEFISGATVLVGDTVKLEVDGETLRCYVNNVQVGSDNDITGIQSGNNAGLFAAGATGAVDPVFGDLEIGTLVSDTIEIDAEADRKIFPVFGATRSHTISGTYSGVTVPTNIEYRVEEFIGGATVSDWAVLDASPSAGTYSGTVNIPKGNFYKILTRFSNLTSIITNTNRIGFGILAEFSGQSNTVSLFGVGNVVAVNDNTAIFDGSTVWALPNTEIVTEALNALAVANSCVVGAYDTSVGSSDIASFVSGGANYAARQAALTAAGSELNFFYWGQGESDVGGTQANYESELAVLHTDILTRTSQASSTLPMFIAQLGRNDGATGNDSGWQGIRAAQTVFANTTTDVYISHQTMDLPMGDALHRNTSGSVQECLRFSDSFNAVYIGSGDNGLGVIPTSASASGSDVEITHDFNGSTLITLPANSKDGYEVSEDDFSTLLTINSIATSTNKITLTMAVPLTTSAKVRSQQGQDPDNAKMPVGDVTYNSQTVMVEPIVTELAALLISSTLNLTITGIPDGSFMTVLDDDSGVRLQRQNETYASEVVSISLPVAIGTTIKGYVDDNTNPSSDGAYIEGVTV